MIHGMIHKTRGKSFFVLIPISPENKKPTIPGIGFEFCGYAFPPVKVPVPRAKENHFLEGMEKVLRFLIRIISLKNSQGIYQDSYKLQGEAYAFWWR